jgi:hypothetical protein
MSFNLVEIRDMMRVAIIKSRLLREGILKSQWGEIVGELSKKSFVMFLREKKLFIGVENSMWIQHMNFQKKNIIKKVNEFLNGEYIEDIIFRVGKKNIDEYFLEELEEDDMEEINLDEISLTEDEEKEIELRLLEIDEKLRGRLKGILEKSYKRKKFLKLHGYKKCQCGAYYKSGDNKCAVCKNKEILERESFIMGELKKGELLSYSQALKKVDGLTEKEYQRIKLKELSKLKNEIDIRLKNSNEKKALELGKLYFLIELGKIDAKELEKRAKEFIEILKIN